ncbi:MAG: lipase [Microcystis sp. LE19-84.1B]|uniref:lipase family protein n=1 Tax=Microcystis sp. LE19-84.1B TaxID=3016438 RepID=UPI0022BE5760|nr:lipase [Microcystis sp. LE19-84.1B]MCZ8224132.1 lipase [Microcystis sp. LE19-84.1B]
MPTYDQQQTLFCLSMFANISDSEKVIADLADPTVQAKIGQWTILWGPVIYYHDPKNQNWDNIMYVAKGENAETNNPQYVVAIAATNPKSSFDWLQEDAATHNMVSWSTQFPERGKISQGTNTGITILQNLKDSSNRSLLEFLTQEIPSQSDQPIEIITTGHSLGGALSPVMALWLYENQATWNPTGKQITVNTQFSAGATPGDQTFSDYYGNTQPGLNQSSRLWNSLDIVPHAWNIQQLQQIPTLYQSCNIPKSSRIALLVNSQIQKVKNCNYLALNPSTFAMKGQCGVFSQPQPNPLKQFLQEAYFQHIQAYFNLLEIDWPLTENVADSLTLTEQDLDDIATKLS